MIIDSNRLHQSQIVETKNLIPEKQPEKKPEQLIFKTLNLPAVKKPVDKTNKSLNLGVPKINKDPSALSNVRKRPKQTLKPLSKEELQQIFQKYKNRLGIIVDEKAEFALPLPNTESTEKPHPNSRARSFDRQDIHNLINS